MTGLYRLPVKTAALSHILPPSPSGQSTILSRIFQKVHPDDYCLLSAMDYRDMVNDPGRLPGPYHHIESTRLPGPGLSPFFRILGRAARIHRVIQKEKCRALIACTGDIFDPPAGYLAARRAKIPFYAYLFDDFVYQWTAGHHRHFARLAEKWIIRDAAGVIAPNPYLAREYQRRHRVRPTIIPNVCDPESLMHSNSRAEPDSVGTTNIVFTGAVYHANYGCFRLLIEAIRRLGRDDIRLHIYTSQPESDLTREGITGPVVVHGHRPAREIYEIQRGADILFLPLDFNSPIPELVKTSAPGKMGDYLAAGRPILALAPPGSYVIHYLTDNRCGLAVDRNSSEELALSLERIIGDRDYRRELAANAWRGALRDFNLDKALENLVGLLSGAVKTHQGVPR